MKKLATLGIVGLSAITLAACGNNDTSKKSQSSSAKTEKVKHINKQEDPSERKWTYNNNVFDAGIETYKFTKSEIRDSSTEGKKVLVLYCDVTNNSNKEQDPSNVYMVVHAYQKTDTANKELNPGMVALDENADNPLQKYEDGLNDSLLPHKTTQAVIEFELVNDKNVTVKFSDSNFKTIGQKIYNVE